MRLFDRDSRGARLTPAGSAFYGEARRLLVREDLVVAVPEAEGAGTGAFR